MRDHLVTIKEHLKFNTIHATPMHMGLTGPQLVVLSTMLWAHLGRCMDVVQRRARKRVAGEALNGFELWRKLFWDHLDGGVLSENRGATHFRNHPRCEDIEKLQAHIDAWDILRAEVASEMADRNLLPMFHGIIPKEYGEVPQLDP